MTEIKSIDRTYVANTYARFDVALTSGKGSVAFDENGTEYIDMGAGIAVNLFGYSDPVWQQAVIQQLQSLQHTSNLYYTEPCAMLAKELCERTGMKKVFYCNSGAEANECAIKAARKYGSKKGDGYYQIITMTDSFHGRTLTTLAATGQDHFHELFQPLTPGFLYAKDMDDIQKYVETEKVAGILLECVQGEGGVNVFSKDFIQGVYDLCQKEDIILIVDEVQTGNGRCGELYAFMHYGIMPDVVTTAKGLGGGLPIGCTMLGEKVKDIFAPGDNGSTFGGNPVVCAGALSNLQRIDDNLLKEVRRKGQKIMDAFENAEGVNSVSGLGLMIGIEPKSKKASDIAAECLKKHVLVLTAGHNRLRLLPALNIEEDLLDQAIAVIKEAFKEG